MVAKGLDPVIIVGGGLAGLTAAVRLAEKRIKVKIISLCPTRRSHSACAQGGINAVFDTIHQGDSTYEHFLDTIYGGDYLANQSSVKQMCESAPEIINYMIQMGVAYNRKENGELDLRMFGGGKKNRTVYAGTTTGQQMLHCCDEQVQKWMEQGMIEKYESWEFVSLIKDDNRCNGVVVQNVDTLELKSFRSNAVILATGGAGYIYGKSTNSLINTGAAASSVYQQGVLFANGEFVQIHPTGIQGRDKIHLISEAARGEGGRIWTYKDNKPWYFLEEMYPEYGNLVPRDIAARAIYEVCVKQRLGVDGEKQVYLDLRDVDESILQNRLAGVANTCKNFYSIDPKKEPIKVFPAVHYFMGGLHVDNYHMTNIKGLFSIGECDYMYHGANRLGANSLLAAIYSGFKVAPHVLDYILGMESKDDKLWQRTEHDVITSTKEEYERIKHMNGNESPYKLHQEMGTLMSEYAFIERNNRDLQKADEKLQELQERWDNITINSSGNWGASSILFVRQLRHMMELARVVVISALHRNESRGAHYKPEFPYRDDDKWLKTTLAKWTPQGPKISYQEVDTSFITPGTRSYDTKGR
ncbi:succinate dehydrogenase / fumarate reductase flavoprotein subunit [Desulfitispora alkaliphila]|uniref:succinate dehydrogenase (quinone) flavoprotein subunit n=1 Tax=Desulfitispora alkaliphila TaxID=622674 RepID=UPI003D1E9BBF